MEEVCLQDQVHHGISISDLLGRLRQQMEQGTCRSVYIDLNQRWVSFVDTLGCRVTVYATGAFTIKGLKEASCKQVHQMKQYLLSTSKKDL